MPTTSRDRRPRGPTAARSLWDELFPAEQARIIQLVVERVEIAEDWLDIRMRSDGLAGLVREFGMDARAAA
jgi:site-specific DNA recombinase